MKMLLLFISILFLSSCQAQVKEQVVEEIFETDNDGIIAEKVDTTNKDENRYNHNNKIYKVGRKFSFNYYYEDKNGNKLLMTQSKVKSDRTYDWKFENIEKQDSNSVNQIILKVKSGLSPFIQNYPDYNQTVILYEFQMTNGEFWNNEMTGVIENSKNIWMHPPRTDLFKILELNPFPYIKAPYEVGNKWNWQLNFGDHWADKRWLEWKGENLNKYNYEIIDKTTITTKLGKLECYVIESEATSNLGSTKLTSYFNETYGFVKLDYTNIDRTKIIIELNDVSDNYIISK